MTSQPASHDHDESHLRHKKAQLSEAKDEFMNGSITYEAYNAVARRLEKEIKELEKSLGGGAK